VNSVEGDNAVKMPLAILRTEEMKC